MNLTPEQVLEMYRSGSYGTPESPIRSSSVKAAFWMVYLGHRSASEYRNNIHYAAAKAGALAKKQES